LSLGVLLGLALLVKQSAIVLALAVVLVPVIDWLRHQTQGRKMLLHVCLPLGVAGLIYLPWALRNWRVYGTFTPESLSAVPITWPSTFYGVASATHNLVRSFWAVSGIANNVGYPMSAVGMLFMAVAFLALLRACKWPALRTAVPAERVSLLTTLAIAITVNVLLVLRFGYQTGMGQGRHLFGLVLPIALLLAFGARSLPMQNSAVRVAGFWITYALAFVIFSLYRFP
jgi:hypothetical protein